MRKEGQRDKLGRLTLARRPGVRASTHERIRLIPLSGLSPVFSVKGLTACIGRTERCSDGGPSQSLMVIIKQHALLIPRIYPPIISKKKKKKTQTENPADNSVEQPVQARRVWRVRGWMVCQKMNLKCPSF